MATTNRRRSKPRRPSDNEHREMMRLLRVLANERLRDLDPRTRDWHAIITDQVLVDNGVTEPSVYDWNIGFGGKFQRPLTTRTMSYNGGVGTPFTVGATVIGTVTNGQPGSGGQGFIVAQTDNGAGVGTITLGASALAFRNGGGQIIPFAVGAVLSQNPAGPTATVTAFEDNRYNPEPVPDGYVAEVTRCTVLGGFIPDPTGHPPVIYDTSDWLRWSWLVDGNVYPGCGDVPAQSTTVYGIPSYTPFATKVLAGYPGNLAAEQFRNVPLPGHAPFMLVTYDNSNAAWQAAPPVPGDALVTAPGGGSGCVAAISDLGGIGSGILWITGESWNNETGASWQDNDVITLVKGGALKQALCNFTVGTGVFPRPVGEPLYNPLEYVQEYKYPVVRKRIRLVSGQKSVLRILNYGGNGGKNAAWSAIVEGIMYPKQWAQVRA